MKEKIPLKNIKSINYNRHWLGIIPGFFAGILLGAILVPTKIIPTYVDEGNPPKSTYDYIGATVIGVPLGILIGSVVGWFVGYDYIYIFHN